MAAARNAGVLSQPNGFEFIYFCDADSVVPKAVLVEHEHAHRQADARKLCVYSGLTRPSVPAAGLFSSEQPPRPPAGYDRLVKLAQVPKTDRFWLNVFSNIRSGHPVPNYIWARTGTRGMSIHADDFREIGMFDPILRRLEDWDLSLRLLNKGGKFHFVPGIPIVHLSSPKPVFWHADALMSAKHFSEKHTRAIVSLRNSQAAECSDTVDQFLKLADEAGQQSLN